MTENEAKYNVWAIRALKKLKGISSIKIGIISSKRIIKYLRDKRA